MHDRDKHKMCMTCVLEFCMRMPPPDIFNKFIDMVHIRIKEEKTNGILIKHGNKNKVE